MDVVILVLRRRGRGGVGRVGEGVRRKLRRPEDEEDPAAAAGPEGAAGWPGEEGDAEEGGEAREEVERRAADQREDAVGRERLRVARHPLPRRRRPARHPHHPPRPHRHELNPTPQNQKRAPNSWPRRARGAGKGRGGAHGTKAGGARLRLPAVPPRGSRAPPGLKRFAVAAVNFVCLTFAAGSSRLIRTVALSLGCIRGRGS